jgi:hypothetical protein
VKASTAAIPTRRKATASSAVTTPLSSPVFPADGALAHTFVPLIAKELTVASSRAAASFRALRTGGVALDDTWTFTVVSVTFGLESFSVSIHPQFLTGNARNIPRDFSELCSCGYPYIHGRPCDHLLAAIFAVAATPVGSKVLVSYFVDERFFASKYLEALQLAGSMLVPAVSVFDQESALQPGAWLAENVEAGRLKELVKKAERERRAAFMRSKLGMMQPDVSSGSYAYQSTSLKRRKRGMGRHPSRGEVELDQARRTHARNTNALVLQSQRRTTGSRGGKRGKGTSRCSICDELGHNKRTCPVRTTPAPATSSSTTSSSDSEASRGSDDASVTQSDDSGSLSNSSL